LEFVEQKHTNTKGGIHMNREDVIEQMVEQYRAQLEEQEDEELLGNRLKRMREDANVLVSNMLESLREETIEEMVEQYQKELERKSDHELASEDHDDSELLGEPRMIKIGKPADIPDDPKAHYSMTGEWRGWRDFLGVPAHSPICDECGNHPCDCGMDVAAKESSK
jgi:hypothetical protein